MTDSTTDSFSFDSKNETMAKLNQLIAVLNGKKSQCQKAITEVYKNLRKPTLFEGISRIYQPLDEEGESLPPENKNIQYRSRQAIQETREALVESNVGDSVGSSPTPGIVSGRTVARRIESHRTHTREMAVQSHPLALSACFSKRG